MPANIARALIGGLKHDIPADDAELRRLVPQRLLGFREAVRGGARGGARRTRSRRAGPRALLMFRGYRHDNAFYAKRAGGSAVDAARRRRRCGSVVTTIGGDNGYYYMDWLWRLRERARLAGRRPGPDARPAPPDRAAPGRHASTTGPCSALEPERRLTLHFGMRAPGAGVLEFELEPLPRRPAPG